MEECSINNTWLEFVGYKIVNISCDVMPIVGLLMENATTNNAEWAFGTGFSPITSIAGESPSYVVTFGMKADFVGNDNLPKNTEKPYISAFGAISGIFRIDVEEKLLPKAEEQLKVQGPAILAPFLRAAMTSVLSISGFSGIIFPLINVYDLAKKESFEIIRQDTSEPAEAIKHE